MNKSKPIQETILVIMKVSLGQVLLMIVLTSLVYSADLKGQELLDRIVTLNEKHREIRKILYEIEKQASVVFTYQPKAIQPARKISIEVNNAKIIDVLNQLFDSGVSFSVIGDEIILWANEGVTQRHSSSSDNEFVREVSGNVVDESGQPMPGVNILEKGSVANGTSTDGNGHYLLNVGENSVLLFSFIGYSTQEVNVNNRNMINITMRPDVQALGEVIVVGYGEQKKVDLTGAVSTVETKDIPTATNVSVSNMLQGRVPGISITTRSAQPAGGLDINIRGANSPNGSNAPLFVIDGVAINQNAANEGSVPSMLGYSGGVDRDPLSSINPNDIESITILRDASSTAIYGSAAANGVILVTTKKGKAGKVITNYTGSYSIQKAKDYLPMLNATQFRQQNNRLTFERYLFDNKLAPYGQAPYVSGYTPRFSDDDIRNAGEGTNWMNEITRDGVIQDHSLAISGGSEKFRIFTSFNYYDNKAILENSTFKRYTGRVNVDYDINDWVRLKVNAFYSQTNANNASTNTSTGGSEKFNSIMAAQQYPPDVEYDPSTFDVSTKSPYDPQFLNPMAFLEMADKSRNSRVFIAPKFEVNILPNLKASVQLGFDESTYLRNFYAPAAIKMLLARDGVASFDNNKTKNTTAESYLTYTASLNDIHSFSVVAGAGHYKGGNEGYGSIAVGFFTDAFGYHNMGVAYDKNNSSSSSYKDENTKVSLFSRINYSLKNKYLFSVTARRDGSSAFAENNKYGFFPGAAVAWKLAEENFIKSIPEISELKIRAGYGAAGNESVMTNRSYSQSLYKTGYNAIFGSPGVKTSGATLAQIGNPDLTWETNTTTNVGLDFGLFNDRLSGSFDYFLKTTKDLLDFNKLPSNGPVATIADNVGSTRSTGCEFSLNTEILTGTFKWLINLNISTYQSYWVERNPNVALNPWVSVHDPIRAIYGWETDGLITSEENKPSYMPDAQLGNVKYVDRNGDNKLDEGDVTMLGNNDPKWNMGMTNKFTYKNFDLTLFVYAMMGKKAFNSYGGYNEFTNFLTWQRIGGQNLIYNTVTLVNDIWTNENQTGTLPGVADDLYTGNNPSGATDFLLEDASFLRIKNIMLGYSLPVKEKRLIQNARFFINLDNVGLFTKYNGYDPEISELNPYPQAFTTTLGVNVVF